MVSALQPFQDMVIFCIPTYILRTAHLLVHQDTVTAAISSISSQLQFLGVLYLLAKTSYNCSNSPGGARTRRSCTNGEILKINNYGKRRILEVNKKFWDLHGHVPDVQVTEIPEIGELFNGRF